MGFLRSRARGKDSTVRKTGIALKKNLQGNNKEEKEASKDFVSIKI
jgi:hypothetical protein